MISREEAFKLVTTWTENKQSLPLRGKNLVKHMLAVESAMGGLARYFKEDENLWKIIGLLHDADYDKYPDKHPQVLIDELEKLKQQKEIIEAIRTHAWGYNGFDVEPKTKLEWSLYCCDELTGLIVAVALVRPERKLSVVTVENILSKWNKKDFAKGVERENIELCEEKLGIKLNDFIQIVLTSMQGIAGELGL
jgi:putative nucleotidyltransferase with HDIG domain